MANVVRCATVVNLSGEFPGNMRRFIFMHTKVMLALLLLMVCLVTLVASRATLRRRASGNAARFEQLPRLVLWAWERPTDLRFLDSREAGVAFLARTIRVREGVVVVRPRLQPLDLPSDIKLVAVARIETERPELSDKQAQQTAAAIAEMAALPNISAIQIDFDALESERNFYREVITQVRHKVPSNIAVSITALASWCAHDNWISDLPIDEAVPMLFRMGTDRKRIMNRLDADKDFTSALCRLSYGISTDEQRPKTVSARRLYVFNPDPWTEQSVRELLESIK